MIPMRIDFYCGASTSTPLAPSDNPGDYPECGAEWFEELDENEGHPDRTDSASTYYATCPMCGAEAEASVPYDPEAP